MTPGYGKRTTELSSLSLGGYGSGVRVIGTSRAENAAPDLRAPRHGRGPRRHRHPLGRLRAADVGDRRARQRQRPLDARDQARDLADVGDRLAAVDDDADDAVEAAKDLAASLNRIADATTRSAPRPTPRSAARSTRSTTRCSAIDDINKKIATLAPQGVDVTGLQDQRSRLIDRISSIVPVKTVKRDGDQLAIYSANGGVLLDGRVFALKLHPGRQHASPPT